MQKYLLRCFLSLLLLGLSLSLIAGGPKLNLNGIRNLGMAHVGTGLRADASVVWFNPGAISLLDRHQLQIGATAVIPRTSFLGQFPSLYQTQMLPQTFTPAYLYAALGLGKGPVAKRKWWLGVAVNNPFLLSSRWPDEWAGNQLSQEFSLTIFTVQPTVSWQIHPRLGIGAGISVGVGNMLIRKSLPENGPDDTQTDLQYSGAGTVLGYNAGIFYQATDLLAIGLSYRSAQTLAIDSGEARYNVPLSLRNLYPDGNFSVNVPLPGFWNLGVNYQANERLQVVAEINHGRWDRLDSLKMDFEPEGLQVQDTAFVHQFKNTWTMRLAGSYQLNGRFQLRTGLFYDLSPVQNGWLSPEIPHANQIGLSAGLGVNLVQGLELDLAYLYEYAGERTSFYRPAAFGGTYLNYSFYLGMGIRYKI